MIFIGWRGGGWAGGGTVLYNPSILSTWFGLADTVHGVELEFEDKTEKAFIVD